VKQALLLAGLVFWALGACASPVTLHLLSFDGPVVNGIPTYPYTLQIDGESPFFGMCNDYYHDGTPGDKWHANLTNLGSGDLSTVRFASSGLLAYQEAAWILLQTGMNAPTEWPDLNYAVWAIFNPSLPIGPSAQSWIDSAQAEARKKFPSANFSLVEIATPVDINAPETGDQEFMYITPEPGSLILLGSGALGIAGVLRKHWKP
jgi:hypothetical protein